MPGTVGRMRAKINQPTGLVSCQRTSFRYPKTVRRRRPGGWRLLGDRPRALDRGRPRVGDDAAGAQQAAWGATSPKERGRPHRRLLALAVLWGGLVAPATILASGALYGACTADARDSAERSRRVIKLLRGNLRDLPRQMPIQPAGEATLSPLEPALQRGRRRELATTRPRAIGRVGGSRPRPMAGPAITRSSSLLLIPPAPSPPSSGWCRSPGVSPPMPAVAMASRAMAKVTSRGIRPVDLGVLIIVAALGLGHLAYPFGGDQALFVIGA
jgi:hypothetical protein